LAQMTQDGEYSKALLLEYLPHVGPLDDGILFCMKTAAQLVPLPRWHILRNAQAPARQAMFKSRRGAIVTRRQDATFPHEDSAYCPS